MWGPSYIALELCTIIVSYVLSYTNIHEAIHIVYTYLCKYMIVHTKYHGKEKMAVWWRSGDSGSGWRWNGDPLKEEAESKKPPTISCQEGPQKSGALKARISKALVSSGYRGQWKITEPSHGSLVQRIISGRKSMDSERIQKKTGTVASIYLAVISRYGVSSNPCMCFHLEILRLVKR